MPGTIEGVTADDDVPGLFERLQADPRVREALEVIRASGRSAATAAWETLKERIDGNVGQVVEITGSDAFTFTEVAVPVHATVGLRWAVEASAVVYPPGVVLHAPMAVIEDARRPYLDDQKAFALLWLAIALAGVGMAVAERNLFAYFGIVTAAMQPIYLLLFSD